MRSRHPVRRRKMAVFTFRNILSWILTYSVFVIGIADGKYCTFYKTDSYLRYNYYYHSSELRYRQSTGTSKYCSSSCCSYDCCYDNSYVYIYYSSAITASAIVGIVIGCLVAIAITVSLIVVCCICMRRNRRQPGQIVTTGGQPVTYITSNQHAAVEQVNVEGRLNQFNSPSYPPNGSNPSYGYPPVVVGSHNTAVGTSNDSFTPDVTVPPPQYETLKK